MDRELYLVLDRSGTLRERSPADMTKTATVEDILSGQFGSIGQVLCVCPAEGTCRDVTEDIAQAVLDAAHEPLRGAALDLVEEEIGIAAAREAEWS